MLEEVGPVSPNIFLIIHYCHSLQSLVWLVSAVLATVAVLVSLQCWCHCSPLSARRSPLLCKAARGTLQSCRSVPTAAPARHRSSSPPQPGRPAGRDTGTPKTGNRKNREHRKPGTATTRNGQNQANHKINWNINPSPVALLCTY